ncbi:hypothetical protein CEXT_301261 [Caerostris extrusa]|uniref:ATP synthase F0 subunit 8 n=1 Tax=Caerostris extrusa TaxID=172846 RepID=A0AAV4MB10_CAEEX|nr:hypothetical protein CEXT_301261 [Caerostris extrusa]
MQTLSTTSELRGRGDRWCTDFIFGNSILTQNPENLNMKDTDKFLTDFPKAETPYDFWMDILIKMLIVIGVFILLLMWQIHVFKVAEDQRRNGEETPEVKKEGESGLN